MIKFRIELPIKLASEGNIDRLSLKFREACDSLDVSADAQFVEKSRLIMPQVYVAADNLEMVDALCIRDVIVNALS